MLKAMEEALRLLSVFVGDDDFKEELKEAREDFFARVTAPLPGEAIEELRLASFIEWFIFDRQRPQTGRTPVEDYLRAHGDGLDQAVLECMRGCSRTLHSVFLVKKRSPRGVDLKDLYTGAKHKQVQRVPVSLGKGDMAELRLIPAGDELFAADALCFHPYSAGKDIKKILKAARKQGRPIGQVLEELMAMNTRYERYPKTAKSKAYAG